MFVVELVRSRSNNNSSSYVARVSRPFSSDRRRPYDDVCVRACAFTYCHTTYNIQICMLYSITAYNRIRPPRPRRRRQGVDTDRQYLHSVLYGVASGIVFAAAAAAVIVVLFRAGNELLSVSGCARVEDADSAGLRVNRGKLLHSPAISRPFSTRARRVKGSDVYAALVRASTEDAAVLRRGRFGPKGLLIFHYT